MQKAYFAAGCFWGVEARFKEIEGVLETTVGYMGGSTQNPTYREVCSDETGHAEVVEVEYDEKVLSFENLLKHFFEMHDPTTLNRQGPDVGTQYRSAIFYNSEQEKTTALEYIAKLTAEQKFSRPIVTKLEPFHTFYSAEEYHQDYLDKNPGMCHI